MNIHTHDKVEIEKPNKVLILGSGALKIGEAGEFDSVSYTHLTLTTIYSV